MFPNEYLQLRFGVIIDLQELHESGQVEIKQNGQYFCVMYDSETHNYIITTAELVKKPEHGRNKYLLRNCRNIWEGNRRRIEVRKLTDINTRVVFCKYLPATGYHCSRVKITDRRFKKTVTLSFNHEWDSMEQIAVNYLLDLGFDILGTNNDMNNESIIIMRSWDSEKQIDGVAK